MEDVTGQSGTLETPKDAGEGAEGEVARWVMELELSDKTEKTWRERAKKVNDRYRDERAASSIDASDSSGGERFNILYSNVQTICPALFNQSPKPDVRKRYRDDDPIGTVIADISERSLSFTMDESDIDRFLRLAVKDQQLSGRGVTRVIYEPAFDKETDQDGEEFDAKKSEEVCFSHVNWADFRRGPGRTWEEVTWVGFRHSMTLAEMKEKFGDIADDVPLDYTPSGVDEKDGPNGDPVVDSFKRANVWEIWDKDKKEVIFVSKEFKDKPIKKEEDPLKLKQFFPIPRPLYATENTDGLTPVEPFKFYADQADELDRLTRRISGIIEACKVRGLYDTTITGMADLMKSSDNILQPAGDVLPLMQSGGLEKAIWMFPLKDIAGVLVYLYQQREAVKTIIFEITGIADIMRGSSAAQETLGAQQLKAQFGTMRLDDMRREVQRYARDLVRMSAEIIAEHFSTDTMQIMTEVQLPTAEQKQGAMMAMQQAQQTGQRPPPGAKKALESPTWDEAMQVLRDDQQRVYRIDIETDSTVAGDQAADQKAITDLLQGIGAFIQTAGPAVVQGYIPQEAAKAILMTAVRRFKMGREVEFALDTIGEGDEEGEQPQQPDPAQMQMQAQAQAEQMQAQQEGQMKMQEAQQKGQMDQAKMQMDGQAKQAELSLKERELALKEQEFAWKAQQPVVNPQEQWAYDQQVARERMQFEGAEADKQRQVELAKALISASGGEEGERVDGDDAMNDARAMLQQIVTAITAPKMIVRDEMGNIVGSETAQ